MEPTPPTASLIELDFSDKLEIRIDNRQPVELTDLTLALLGVAQQFGRFIENETEEQYHGASKLFIKEVRKGSIIVELIAQALPVAPLLWSGGSLLEWANHAKSVIEWLNGKANQPPKQLTKPDLQQWSQILDPVAKDHGSQMNFTVSQGGVVNLHLTVTSEQANIAQNGVRRQIEQLEMRDENIRRQCVMVWAQTKFEPESTTGDRAVIESISRSPVKVVFENQLVKTAMLAGDRRFAKPWHELAYLVDVRVQTVQGVPKVYQVLTFHPQDTFDPDET